MAEKPGRTQRKGTVMKRRRFKTNLHLLLHHPLLFAKAYWWALLILLIGTILDGVTTYPLVEEFGPHAEVHPGGRLVMWLLGAGWGTLVTKFGQVVAAVFVASLWRPWCRWLLALCGVVYAAAAVANHFRLV